MARVRIGMGQMHVDYGAVAANLSRAEAYIDRAARAGCDVVVLPECLNVGWMHPESAALSAAIPGAHADALAAAAGRAGIHVVAGLAETDGAHAYNAAVLISNSGRILLKHRKVNELEVARRVYRTGTTVSVAETSFGTIGIPVCADNAPDTVCIGHTLALLGARLLLSPCAWAVPPDFDHGRTPYGDMWRRSYGELARAHAVPVVGVSHVGPISTGSWAGWRCIGCSLAMGPDGQVLAEGPFGEDAEALVTVDVDVAEPVRPPGLADAAAARSGATGPLRPAGNGRRR